jgi:hypothetical protein
LDEHVGSERVTAVEVIKRATETTSAASDEKHELRHPGFREALVAVAGQGGELSNKRSRKWLSSNQDRIVNGKAFPTLDSRQGVAVLSLQTL